VYLTPFASILRYYWIIHKSLKSFSAVRHFPPAIQRIVLNAFVSSSEKAFGTYPLISLFFWKSLIDIAAISRAIMVISVVAAFYIPEAEQESVDDRVN
jgi:hypothetical protein